MEPRNKQPDINIRNLASRVSENRANSAAMDYISRCLVSKIRVPDAETVAIVPESGLNGSDLMQIVADGSSQIYNRPTTAEVDLATAGIGGLVSGVSLVDGDYLYWGFIDPTKQVPFVGFGATKRPVEEGTGIVSGTGAKGSTTEYGGLSNGYTFSIGSRVIVHEGNGGNPETAFNQGYVTATTASTVTVEMDSETYGATIPNAALRITQTDRYEPLLTSDGTIFGGYRYAYLGSSQRDAGAITYTRQRGQYYWEPTSRFLKNFVQSASSTSVLDTCFMVGTDTREIEVHCRARHTSGVPAWTISLGQRTGIAPYLMLSAVAAAGAQYQSETIRIPLRADGTGITARLIISPGAANLEAVFWVNGWLETRF